MSNVIMIGMLIVLINVIYNSLTVNLRRRFLTFYEQQKFLTIFNEYASTVNQAIEFQVNVKLYMLKKEIERLKLLNLLIIFLNLCNLFDGFQFKLITPEFIALMICGIYNGIMTLNLNWEVKKVIQSIGWRTVHENEVVSDQELRSLNQQLEANGLNQLRQFSENDEGKSHDE